MKKTLLAIFLLIVFVPMGLLGWLGIRVAEEESRLVKDRFSTLVDGRLKDLDAVSSETFSEVEQHFLKITNRHFRDREELWSLIRSEPLIRQIFVVDGQGELVHPKRGVGLSEEEEAFLKRTRPIWKRDAVLYVDPADEAPEQSEENAQVRVKSYLPASLSRMEQRQNASPPPKSRSSGGHGDSILDLARVQGHGWISWYWEEGLHLLFWRRSPQGGVIGVEVERIVLLSRIVGALPNEGVHDGRVVLKDSRGDVVTQWGRFDPIKEAAPNRVLALSYPLESWRYEYFSSPAEQAMFRGDRSRVGVLSSLSAVGLMLLLMAAYFWREQSRELVEAGQRVRFVTQVSHELKTPLTNIRLYAEMLQDELEDDPSHKRVEVIVDESQRLSRMISNILTFSKKSRTNVELRPRATRIDDVVAGIVNQFRPSLDAKGVQVNLELGVSAPVFADPDAVGQILGNLVSNVEKYASKGGVLDIRSTERDGSAEVVVRDRGPGIPLGQRERIFQPFYRLSDRLSDGVTGTGIGLGIARDLARLSGGELECQEVEVGASFRLVLPLEGEDEGTRS